MPKKKITSTRTTTTSTSPVDTAAEEGRLLDARLLEIDPARWPAWARARYGVDHPAGEVVEPLRVDEVDR